MKNSVRFTDRAASAVRAAHDSACSLGHSYVGTEHLLLGVAAEREGLGARVLLSKGLDMARLTRAVVAVSGAGAAGEPEQGLTANARAALADYIKRIGAASRSAEDVDLNAFAKAKQETKGYGGDSHG